jgi:hypothetical protein
MAEPLEDINDDIFRAIDHFTEQTGYGSGQSNARSGRVGLVDAYIQLVGRGFEIGDKLSQFSRDLWRPRADVVTRQFAVLCRSHSVICSVADRGLWGCEHICIKQLSGELLVTSVAGL